MGARLRDGWKAVSQESSIDAHDDKFRVFLYEMCSIPNGFNVRIAPFVYFVRLILKVNRCAGIQGGGGPSTKGILSR